MNTKRIFTLTAVAAALSAAIAVPSGAYFIAADGSNSGSGDTGTLVPVVLEALTGTTPLTALQPGSTGEVVLRLNNQNPYPVTLKSVASTGEVQVLGGAGCTTENAGVSFIDQTALAVSVAPGVVDIRLPDAAAMATTSDNSCQGASFALPVTIRVETS